MESMKTWPIEIRRAAVEAYGEGLTRTYAATAKMFGVGIATVDRWLRIKRETGDILPATRTGNNPRRVDLDWLRGHATEFPDARLKDRVEAWEAHSGVHVHIDTMSESLRAIEWTFKKNANGQRTRARRRSNKAASV